MASRRGVRRQMSTYRSRAFQKSEERGLPDPSSAPGDTAQVSCLSNNAVSLSEEPTSLSVVRTHLGQAEAFRWASPRWGGGLPLRRVGSHFSLEHTPEPGGATCFSPPPGSWSHRPAKKQCENQRPGKETMANPGRSVSKATGGVSAQGVSLTPGEKCHGAHIEGMVLGFVLSSF